MFVPQLSTKMGVVRKTVLKSMDILTVSNCCKRGFKSFLTYQSYRSPKIICLLELKHNQEPENKKTRKIEIMKSIKQVYTIP